MQTDKLYGSGHHGHNVHYLATAYSFEGRYDDAMEAAKELLAIPENPQQKASADTVTTAYAQGWFATLRTLVQFEKYDVILDGSTLPEFGRPRQEAWRHWALSLAHANLDNLPAAREEAARFEAALSDYRTKTSRPDPAELQVARLELAGHLSLAEGRTARALKQFQAASKAERRLTYTEPPYYPRPVAEVWGRAAARANLPALSARAFAIALQQYPDDAHAVPPNLTAAR